MKYSGRPTWVTLILCIFGGVLGLHRLNTGHVVMAGLYAINGGFFLVGAIIDAFLIISGIYEDSDGHSLT